MEKHADVAWIVILTGVLWLGVFTGAAGAVEMLRNTGFEAYDAGILVPDDWRVTDGTVRIYTAHAHDGAVSVFSPGGTMVGGTDTPTPPLGGTLAQLVDLSTLPGWGAANWLNFEFRMNYRIWGGTRVTMRLEYLPAAYNGVTVAADDAAWSGPDVKTAVDRYGSNHAGASSPWYEKRATRVVVPRVRWARARFILAAAFKDHSRFVDGPYYAAVDGVSFDARVIAPESPCAGNLLENPGFESVAGNLPTGWRVLSGRMGALGPPDLPPYSGDGYAGNIGGYVTPNPDPAGPPIDHPDPPQNGSLVQVVDLSTLSGWNRAGFVLFSVSGFHMKNGIRDMSYTVEYLPESFNGIPVAWDDAAWDTDARTAVREELGMTHADWRKFETDQGAMPRVRWVRVRLDVEDSSAMASHEDGAYLGGFDQICLQARSFVAGDLIRNGGFEESADDVHPDGWHRDPGDGAAHLMIEPQPAAEGVRWLGKFVDGADTTGRVYQVIDLAENIPGWIAIDPGTGDAVEHPFIQLALKAHVTNVGGSRVSVSAAYLPYSYNAVDGVPWDHPAWRPRQWASDGAAFTNTGGDAVDLGNLIEDTTVSTDPVWREAACDGWLPRVRWLRLCIELDATYTAGPQGLVGIDGLDLAAACTPCGPYSGYGYLPEAAFPEDPDAPDKPVPAWVGPEGDGVSGGYTGQTKRNYVNPAFAGFADAVADYSPSGQNIYNDAFKDPLSITGRPWNDSGWNYVIVTMGDMDIPMLADYFGPAPTGDSHPGEITATFNETPIVNGPGPDFATFENGFVEGWTSSRIFGEIAFVEVSSNGTDFIRFPTHSLTPRWPGGYGTFVASGVFGVTGKHVNAYGDQWGTPFDLDWIADHPRVLNGTVDLMNIRYVRQVDIPGGGPDDANGHKTALFLDSHGNPIFDSWVTWGSGGADLDAIGVVNTSAADTDGDHIADYWDNCARTANDNQYDTDGDGYGNRCDCDIDGDAGGDGVVNLADYAVFRLAFGGTGPERIPGEPGQPDTYTDPSENWNPDADFNGDNTVNLADYAIFRARWGAPAPYN